MFDDDTCIRCTRIAGSFPKRSVEELVTEMTDDRDSKRATATKEEWDEAESNLAKTEAGESVVFDKGQSTLKRSRAGYRVSAKYGFATVPEFIREFKVEPKSISMKVVSRRSRAISHAWSISVK